MGISVF